MALNEEFDKIELQSAEKSAGDECAATAPSKWKVYFEGNFWGHHGRARAGVEIPVGKKFVWGEEIWHIPSVYSCSKGLVIDFCAEVAPARIEAFVKKWNLLDSDESDFSRQERNQIRSENPLNINIDAQVIANKKQLRNCSGCGFSWIPIAPFSEREEGKEVLDHYGLDPEKGWCIHRKTFLWASKRRPELKALSVTLERERVEALGERFEVGGIGEEFTIVHPVTEVEYTLTVQEYAAQEISEKRFADESQEFPTHYTMMTYTLSPELPTKAFTVRDCEESDSPRQKSSAEIFSQSSCAAAIGIIGGPDGPTTIIYGAKNEGAALHAACSALRFEKVPSPKWEMVFCENPYEDIVVDIID